MDPEVARLVQRLQLERHPEGGWFAERFRDARPGAPAGTPGAERPASTSIVYLLERGGFSAFHRIPCAEVWHFHAGSPVELVVLDSRGGAERVRLGPDPLAGDHPQAVVPAGAWQATRALGPGWSLCGCTVAPGFVPGDLELARRDALTAAFPSLTDLVASLTRS